MIILALGSNLSSSFGNRFKNIDKAIEYLKNYDIELIKKSSFYETLSYPNKNDPKFINIVIEISTKLTVKELASKIIIVENKLERKISSKILLTGVGSYLPENKCSNEDLSKYVDTSDEWIFKRSGIKFRHFISNKQTTSDMAVNASIKAIKVSMIKKEDISETDNRSAIQKLIDKFSN